MWGLWIKYELYFYILLLFRHKKGKRESIFIYITYYNIMKSSQSVNHKLFVYCDMQELTCLIHISSYFLLHCGFWNPFFCWLLIHNSLYVWFYDDEQQQQYLDTLSIFLQSINQFNRLFSISLLFEWIFLLCLVICGWFGLSTVFI